MSDDVRITRLATMLLAGVALVTGIAVAIVIETEVERTLKKGLRIGLESYIAQVESSIELRITQASIITTRPYLLEQLRRLNEEPTRIESRMEVMRVLGSFASHGFSAITIDLPNGIPPVRMGTLTDQPILEARFGSSSETTLIWKDGYFLRHRLPLRDARGSLGLVTAEQPLDRLTRALLTNKSFGKSGEFVLCRADTDKSFQCFPTRLTLHSFAIPLPEGGPVPLLFQALAKGHGFGISIDYRGVWVLGAYGPVGNSGLYAMLKIDVRELYGPIGEKFFLVLILIVLLIAGGVFLVRVRVRPLAAALEARVRERTAEIAAANARLAESEERFRQVAEMSCQWIWEQDASGRYTFCSPAVRDILGYRPEDMVGRRYCDFFTEEPLPLDEDGIASGQAFSGLVNRYRHRDGHEVYTESTGAPIMDEQGQVVKWRGMSFDIGLLRAKQAAEAASRAKSEFLANMSHEIRTPINGIIGMTDLALETALTQEQREYLKMARESADSLVRLINDILDFSKIEAGKLDLESIPFNLRDRLEGVVKSLALRAHKQGLELVCHIPPEVPDRLLGDPGRFCQVIINLVGNAIKFTEQGEVLVEVEVESETLLEVILQVSVKDTGIGIPVEKQRSIFDVFAQVDSSMTRKYGGTGLGLAISSRLVTLMGGRIWLESEPGKGSTFHFTVQFGIQSGIPALRSVELSDVKGLQVLVVDDNATNRRILEEMLTAWGMRPTAVANGWEALREMKRRAERGVSLPLVLLDAMMPGMDGFELAERIKQHPEFAKATIMMLSSSAQYGDADRCRALGMAAFLMKPLRQSDLLEAILSTQRQLSDAIQVMSHAPNELPETIRRYQVLLAEDHPVNQRLVVRMLEKRGHVVRVANNGREALAALEQEAFDLILMDVQMPEMDGFEATAAIRERERETHLHIPIIAMTAHALKGDRERCLAAGMDAYLSKPLQSEQLFELLDNLPLDLGSEESPIPETAELTVTTLDPNLVLSRVDGDRKLLHEIIGLFMEQTPRLLGEIRQSIENLDGTTLQRAAHALKGSIGIFGAQTAFDAALRLERLGRDNDFVAVEATYSELIAELQRLEADLIMLRRLHPVGDVHENFNR
jgi:PAS domain S-box-containing protein